MSVNQALNSLLKGKLYASSPYSAGYAVEAYRDNIYTLVDESNPHKPRVICEYNKMFKTIDIKETALPEERARLESFIFGCNSSAIR